MGFWDKLFGKLGKANEKAVTRLEKAKCELAAIVQEDGRVAQAPFRHNTFAGSEYPKYI